MRREGALSGRERTYHLGYNLGPVDLDYISSSLVFLLVVSTVLDKDGVAWRISICGGGAGFH